MRKNYVFLIGVLLSFTTLGTINAQSGNGHDPTLVLSYTPSGYSVATTMRQDDGYTTFAKSDVNNNGGDTELFVNFTFDTSGMNVFCVYTTNGTAPTKSNGTSVGGTFSNFSDPNRTWTVSIPSSANTSGTTVEYVFYISNTDLASGFGRVTPGGGYQTTWTEGDERGYTYTVFESNVSSGGNWSSTTTWNSGSVPNSSSTPVEIIGTNAVTLDQDASTADFNAISGSIFNLNAGEGLTVTGNISNNGTITANSGSSIIVSGTSSGNITYNRNLGTTNWYLVSAPVTGETIEDLIANNSFDTGTGSNIGLASYDNTQTTAADRWNYQTATATGPVTAGGGVAVKLSTAGDLTITGDMQVADVGVSITDGTGSGGNAFNLVGNPYTSFLAANTNADATNNLLTVNSANLTENTLWFWDQGTGTYDQINQASAAFHVAPAQGFFVSSTGSNTFDFTEAMQSHQSSDSFQRSTNNRPEIILVMTDGTLTRDTDIYYIEGKTTAFDNGYDSSMFGGAENEFAIYTHLVSDSQGQDLGIQSLPDNNFENMIIPVGINATAGTDITISAGVFNLPTGINVYLEDKNDNSFTLLDSASDFTTTLDTNLNGIGRFYLHTSSQALSVDEINLDNISIYTSGNNNLRVVGVQNGTAQVRMYNILGKQVMQSSFEGTGTDDIALPTLRTGVYIVQLETETGKLNKKVIIE
jgi:hypothetical protein